MCGIAGIVALREDRAPCERDALQRMAAVLRHRGPDEAGLYRDAHAGLVHTRLAIIDLATGQQPLSDPDENLWIVFNGEIFNYVELRGELEELGHRFRTKSDTEVIVQAYAAWGEAAVERLNGQWAFGLWDAGRRKLVLSRDPLGICPLYVHVRDGVLTFASEVKAIFASDASIDRRLDPRGLEETFTFWSVVPPQSVFAGIEELPPGCTRTLADGRVHERHSRRGHFPSPGDPAAFSGTLEEAVEKVREALERATRLRLLRSDVSVGSYLSGGLDSSLVAALARRAAGGTLHTFSIRFEEAEYDETDFQRMMVAQLGSEHHELMMKRAEIAAVFPDVIYHTERPILRTAPAPLFCLSRLVRERGIKVVLTGEGADEAFAGYDLFREGKVRRFWAREPGSKLRPRALERLYPYLARSPLAQRAVAQQFFGRDLGRFAEPGFAHDTRWRGASALQRLYSSDQRAAAAKDDVIAALRLALPREFAAWSPLQQDQFLEMRTLLAGYLLSSQGDRMLTAHSVEGRFPFLDPEVVTLAHALPEKYKLRVLDEKHVLKRAACDLVPAAIVARKKQPYRAPDTAAFATGHAPDYVDALLSERAVAASGVFEPRLVGRLWTKCRAQSPTAPFSNADNMALVGVLSTQLVHHHFIARRPDGGPTVVFRRDIDRVMEVCR